MSQVSVPAGEIVIPGDDSCLFNAMAYELRRLEIADPSMGANEMRTALCDYMAANGDTDIGIGERLRDFTVKERGEKHDQYVLRMRRLNEWGGVPELAACANLFNVCVMVYQRDGDRGYTPHSSHGSKNAVPTINLVYVGGVHYNVLKLEARHAAIEICVSPSPTVAVARHAAIEIRRRAPLNLRRRNDHPDDPSPHRSKYLSRASKRSPPRRAAGTFPPRTLFRVSVHGARPTLAPTPRVNLRRTRTCRKRRRRRCR